MTDSDRGDVVLVEVTFSDDSGTKRRPAVIVSSGTYHQARQAIIVAAITSNMARRLVGDYVIVDWRVAGPLFPSTATGIIRTLKWSMIERRLGAFAERDLAAFDRVLCRSLGL